MSSSRSATGFSSTPLHQKPPGPSATALGIISTLVRDNPISRGAAGLQTTGGKRQGTRVPVYHPGVGEKEREKVDSYFALPQVKSLVCSILAISNIQRNVKCINSKYQEKLMQKIVNKK